MIFVFESNMRGADSDDVALHARLRHGAVHGVGAGRTGQAYAIPTQDRAIRTLPLGVIQRYVNNFLKYAREHPRLCFQVTKIGCSLTGYKESDIAPMFRDAPGNCWLPYGWRA